MPGGCTIGSRPIDLHLKGPAIGAKISQTAGYIEARPIALHGAHIYMDSCVESYAELDDGSDSS